MVTIRWSLNSHHALIQIVDNGPGLLNPQNAFVPFYTTKGAGSGIGLVLCRQIVEAHGGTYRIGGPFGRERMHRDYRHGRSPSSASRIHLPDSTDIQLNEPAGHTAVRRVTEIKAKRC